MVHSSPYEVNGRENVLAKAMGHFGHHGNVPQFQPIVAEVAIIRCRIVQFKSHTHECSP